MSLPEFRLGSSAPKIHSYGSSHKFGQHDIGEASIVDGDSYWGQSHSVAIRQDGHTLSNHGNRTRLITQGGLGWDHEPYRHTRALAGLADSSPIYQFYPQRGGLEYGDPEYQSSVYQFYPRWREGEYRAHDQSEYPCRLGFQELWDAYQASLSAKLSSSWDTFPFPLPTLSQISTFSTLANALDVSAITRREVVRGTFLGNEAQSAPPWDWAVPPMGMLPMN